MKMKYSGNILNLLIKLFLLFSSIILQTSCYQQGELGNTYPVADGRYDTEYPLTDCSDELGLISKSIKRISNTVYYRTVLFMESEEVTPETIHSVYYDDKNYSQDFFNKTTHGTGTIIYYDGVKIALITSAHVLNYPDTVLNYFPPPDDKYLREMNIKVNQQLYVDGLSDNIEFTILAMDDTRDIAVLGASLPDNREFEITVFPYPVGNSDDLRWGNFVYIMGFPMGIQMVTTGIISLSRINIKNTFMIDALFNRGFSGGIVLAIRDGVPNFELVGMTMSVSSENGYFLVPDLSLPYDNFPLNRPYTGDIYLSKETTIKYGITYAITTESIRRFFQIYRNQLLRQGYDFSSFISN